MGHVSQTVMPYFHYIAQRLLSTGSFILGIGFAHTHNLYMLPALVSTTACSFLFSQSKKQTALQLLFFTAGYLSLFFQCNRHNRIVTQLKHKTLAVEAIIESIEVAQHNLYHYIVTASVQKATDTAGTPDIPQSWRIQCYMYAYPKFEIGDTVAFDKIIVRHSENVSFSTYLIKEHLHVTVFLTGSSYQVIQRPTYHIGRTVERYKRALLKRLRAKCPRTAFTLFASIFLGNRLCVKEQYQSVKDRFHHWGIMHFLARSGLHLVIFIFLLQFALRYIPIPLIIKHLLLIISTGLYALLSWSSISFARACATFGWYSWCRIYDRQIDVATIVLWLTCFFLLCNPALILFLDFQLSFGLTLILSLANQFGTAEK